MGIAAAEALASLGFTGLESEIYAFLLRESPATGYKIAHGIGKPVANVYKAIQSLDSKGAITVESDGSRQCRAIPADEVLGRLAREFETRKSAAEEALANLGHRREAERVIHLRDREGLLVKARDALAMAEKTALLVLTGNFPAELGDAIAAAKERRVQVTLRADRTDPRFESMLIREGDLHAAWPGELLLLVTDGRREVVALVDRWGTLVQAVASDSPFLALLLHQGLSAEAAVAEIAERLEEGAGPKRIGKVIAGLTPASETPGFQVLNDDLL